MRKGAPYKLESGRVRVQTKGGPGSLSTLSQSWNVIAISGLGRGGGEGKLLYPVIYLLEIKNKLI